MKIENTDRADDAGLAQLHGLAVYVQAHVVLEAVWGGGEE